MNLFTASRATHFHASRQTGNSKTSLISIHATLQHCLYCVECCKMTHNKKYSVKQRVQMVWFYVETKSISLTQAKFVNHFDLGRKQG